MNQGWRRIRGALGMGLTWAVAWAVAGVLIGVSSNLFPGRLWEIFFGVFDAPLPALAIPGFVAGTLFSLVLGVLGRGRRFRELSLPGFSAWGAVGGLLLSLVPALLIGGDPESTASIWHVTMVIGGPFVLLSTLSAGGTLLLARSAEASRALEGDDGDAPSLPDGRS